MAAPGPAPNNNGRLLPALAARVLGWLDRPWKAVTFILVLVVSGAGYALWHERAWIKESLVHATPLKLRPDAPQELSELLTDTTADLVSLWAVNLYDNSARFISAARRGDGEPWVFVPRTLPVIGPHTPGPRMARILAGVGSCEMTSDLIGSGPLAQRLLAEKYEYFCIEPVPPSNDRGLLAVIGMAWRKRPDDATAQGALIAAARLAWGMLR